MSTSRPFEIVQVVRRFGPVGGMEDIAWRICCGLADQGLEVTVLCDEVCRSGNYNGKVVEFGTRADKPRWLAHLRYARQVQSWLRENHHSRQIIHCHEMVPQADILSVHSTPHGIYESIVSPKIFDPTWHINRWLERRVISTAKKVVPYTESHSHQIQIMHSASKSLLVDPVAPGTEPSDRQRVKPRGAIGFIGREWERKGLGLVLAIFSRLVSMQSDLRLVVAGVGRQSVEEIKPINTDNIQFLGEINDINQFYDKIDLLIHPARLEAFGLVVTEALARRIPVLVSDRVGASGVVRPENGKVLPIKASLEEWTENARQILRWDLSRIPGYTRPWSSVIEEYMQLYKVCQKN